MQLAVDGGRPLVSGSSRLVALPSSGPTDLPSYCLLVQWSLRISVLPSSGPTLSRPSGPPVFSPHFLSGLVLYRLAAAVGTRSDIAQVLQNTALLNKMRLLALMTQRHQLLLQTLKLLHLDAD